MMAADSGIPGLLTISPADKILSAVCPPSSKSIAAIFNLLRYNSFKDPPSDKKTSCTFFADSLAAHRPLSPRPNLSIRFFISSNTRYVRVRDLVFRKYWFISSTVLSEQFQGSSGFSASLLIGGFYIHPPFFI